MGVRWITAFLDCPANTFEERLSFWCAVTKSTLSARRGERGEFVTFIPPNGDPYLRAQQITEGQGGAHLDLHSEDIRELADAAVALGATIVADYGYLVLRSPGGFAFCIVNWHGEITPPQPNGNPDSLVDEICLDVPFDLYETECKFWSMLTGSEVEESMRADLRTLIGRGEMPLRLGLQQLEATDSRESVTAHLHVGPVRLFISPTELGAEVSHHGRTWSTLCDPAGFHYCLTNRESGRWVR
jgi:Glyoxalase-like domain